MRQSTRNGKPTGRRGDSNRLTATRDVGRRTERPCAPSNGRARPLIVGIGASAGGLEAFKTFFANMPSDSGMAFVLIQHLAPDHESMLVELLGKATEMTVTEAGDGMPVVPNRVFVIPPNATLTIDGGALCVSKPAPLREHRRPIDAFFCSLAEDQGESAICVVLSGSGTDGTFGLKMIKEHGGLTLAQAMSDRTAMTGMPESAAATGFVDHVMPVEDMPAKLLEYQRHLMTVDGRKGPDGTRRDAADHLAKICALLRNRIGHDFSQYKEKTLTRRIQRRMQVLQIDTLPEYIERLRTEPLQTELLFRDLLIGVTQFFRDPEAFEALRVRVLPKLLASKDSADDRIRVWVPGCATGEEAYSIAILLKEAMAEREVAPNMQIFATDIDEHAVGIARIGRYGKMVPDMSPERLERWFTEDGDHYRPIKEIRETCIFSVHSVVKDPPFSKLDLISCRNLLIYMASDLQNRLVRTFHYALRPGGHLFLGPSEMVTRHTGYFVTLDKKHRIFGRRDDAESSLPSFPLSGATGDERSRVAVPHGSASDHDGVDRSARRIMEKYSPAYVVIDRHHDILRFAGQTGKYIEPSPGAASLNLFKILRKALRPVAKAALQEVVNSQRQAVHENLAVDVNGRSQLVNLIVEPILEARGGDAKLYVVAFQESGTAGGDGDTAPHQAVGSRDGDVQRLERELNATKAQLRAAVDELEGSNEELKSANEEYQSVNEELQSSNEELETSKEEQQSINEELQTVNAELNGKNEALGRAISDLQNLLESTQIATIFLNNDLRIKSFTPPMADIFHLRDGDRGRPITDIATRLSYGDLRRDVKKVLRTLSVAERDVRIPQDDATFLMRIRPYRTVDNVIDGVVITFVDITSRKRHEADRARLAAIVDSSQDAIIGHGFDGTITDWNAGAEWIFGYTAAEAIGKSLSALLPEDRSDDVPQILERLRQGERVESFDIDRIRKDGTRIDVSLAISPIKDENGIMTAASTVARDVTERRRADDHRGLLVAELDHRVKNMLAVVSSLAAQTLRTTGSPENFVTTFQGRLKALSQVQRLLTQSNWQWVALRDIVLEELSPYRTERKRNIAVGGDDILLTPKATLALAVALHELAANAAKYGALSASGGRVEVTWSLAASGTGGGAEPVLRLAWIEAGGPPVTPPSRRGFGSQLIERSLAYELGGTVERTFPVEGVRCTIEFPLIDKIGRLGADGGGK